MCFFLNYRMVDRLNNLNLESWVRGNCLHQIKYLEEWRVEELILSESERERGRGER